MSMVAQPEQTVAGQNILPSGGPSVIVRDNLNNPVAGANVTATLSPGSLLGGTTTVATDLGGTASFPDLQIIAAGSAYTLTFTAEPGVSATSQEFPVVPAPPARAAVTVEPGTTVYGSRIAGVPAVTLYDAFDNPVRQGANVAASLNGGSFKAGSTATVSTDVNGVAVFNNLLPGAAGSDYTITFNPAPAGVANVDSAAFDVNALQLTIGGTLAAENKDYDGSATATINTTDLTLVTPVSGDTVSLSGVVAVFGQSNAGTNIDVSITAAGLTGADAGNYTVTTIGAPTTTATIARAPLAITGSFTASNRTYDGTMAAGIATSSLVLAGVVGAEDVTLNPVANFAQASVGTGISVNLSSSTIGGTANLANYSFSTVGAPTASANITKAALTIGGSFTASNKVYDSTAAATIAADSLVLNGVIGPDAVTLNAVAQFSQAGIGTGLTVGLSSSTVGGGDAGNYNLSTVGSPTATADITAKALTITGDFTVESKTYDGTTAATFKTESLALAGLVGGENVTFNKVASFSQAAPGTDLPVNLDSSTIGGAPAANYSLSFVGAPTTTADIAARLVTITGSFAVENKTYDGATAAIITTNSLTLVGLAPGDATTTLDAVANFSQPGVGNGLTVSLGDSTLTGVAASAYTLSFLGAPTTTANITKATATVGGGFTANNKTYNGDSDATFLTDNLQLIGVVPGQDVTLTNKEIDFATANVGVQTVSLTSAELGGADKDNYTLSLTGAPSTTAAITALELTIGGSFTAQNKAYDGSTAATINADGLSLRTPVLGDSVQLTGVTAAFAQADAGTGINVSITAAGLTGAQASNYSVSIVGAPTTTADITALVLTVGGAFTAENKIYDGTTAATIVEPNTIALVGLVVPGDTVSLDALGNFEQADAGTNITVNLDSSVLAGAQKDNYRLIFTGAPTATADITPKNLTITIGASAVVAGQGLADLSPTPAVTMTGLVTGDTESEVTGTPVAFTSVVLPSTQAGVYPDDLGVAANGTKAGNYDITQNPGTLTITPAAAAAVNITAEPVETTAGDVLQGINVSTPSAAQAPTVEVTDAYGNKVSGFDVSVTLSSSNFASGATTVTTDGSGSATFSNLVVNTSGTAYYLTFSGTGVSSVDSAEFSIIAAAARGLAIVQQPTDEQAGE